MKRLAGFLVIAIIVLAILVKVAAKFECSNEKNGNEIFWQPENSYLILGIKEINKPLEFTKKTKFFNIAKDLIEKNHESLIDVEKLNKVIHEVSRFDKIISADNSLAISLAVLPIEAEKIENFENVLDSLVVTMHSNNVETEKEFNELMTKYFKPGKKIGDFASFEKEFSIDKAIMNLDFLENYDNEITEIEKVKSETETFYCLRNGNTIYLTFSPEIFLKNYNRTANKEIAKIDFSKYPESKNTSESVFVNLSEILKIKSKLPKDAQSFIDIYNIYKTTLAFGSYDAKNGDTNSFSITNFNPEELKKCGVDSFSTQPITFFNKLTKDALIAVDINNLKNSIVLLLEPYKKTIPDFAETLNQSLAVINLTEEKLLNILDGEYFFGLYEGIGIIPVPRIIIGTKSANSANVAELVKNLFSLANVPILPQKEGDLEINVVQIPMLPFQIYFIEKDGEFIISLDKNLLLEIYNASSENKLINSADFKNISGDLRLTKANNVAFVNLEKITSTISNALTMFDKKTKEAEMFLDLFGSINGCIVTIENKADKVEQKTKIKFKMQDEQK